MKTLRARFPLNTLGVCLLLLIPLRAAPQDALPEKPGLMGTDRIRLAEAFRLAETVQDKVWAGWSGAPFSVLLVTPDAEFLIRHPAPPEDFQLLGHDDLLKSDVYWRKRQFPTGLLATFPAFGPPSTIVVGQAENTESKTSTAWVITLLHEHFHQLQDSQPGIFKEIEALDLSKGDRTGMWMLNFPFPYEKPEVREAMEAEAKMLATALQEKDGERRKERIREYADARKKLAALLSADDSRYFEFELWKEGVARYTEMRVAQLAAESYQPTKEFEQLPDFVPFGQYADNLRVKLLSQLASLDLAKSKRGAVYPMGAAQALILDEIRSGWREQYWKKKFDLGKYF